MEYDSYKEFNPQIERKVDDLLARMTLAEKVMQMTQININHHGREELEARIRRGAGSLLNMYGTNMLNEFQKMALEESRLGIPLLVGNDVIHGYRTIFPIPLAWSCTWDPELVEEGAHIAAQEAAVDGTNWIFAPMVDICRDLRWGRIAEGAGEDPFLGRAMAAALVRGFQSRLEDGRRIVACPKHYAAYGAAEDGRDYNTVDISERTLRDIYLPPFKAAFDAGAGTVMSSFNEIAGVPASINKFLLYQVLREEMGFTGLVVSDWNALGELIDHGVARDLREAARRAALSGVDMDMVSDAYNDHLQALVEEGAVPETIVDEAVRRILRLKFALGLFENPYGDAAQAEATFLQPDFRKKALDMARKSMVLLKNELVQGGQPLLPLDAGEVKHLALIGPLADDRREILGCWHRIGRWQDSESVHEALEKAMPETEITLVQGCSLEGDDISGFEEALAAAQAADAVVMVLGEAEAMSGEAHSRAHLGLPGRQEDLLYAVTAAGKPLIVVLLCGRPLVIPWLAENAGAILLAWHSGIRTGQAVADLLLGEANPSGKLTASWPRALGQVPIYYAHKNTGRPAGGPGTMQFNMAHRTRFIDEATEPLYPFGYGLSYTNFAYSDLRVTPPENLEGTLRVTAVVTNTGERAGDEIIQLYVRDLVGEVTRPVKELKGFQKISLDPGESKRVTFEIPVQELGFHGLDLAYKVEPGDFHLWLGPDSSQGLEGTFTM
jgi:beta-glucosidase